MPRSNNKLNRKSRPFKKQPFIEDPKKAVFLTGFNASIKGDWVPYREQCYQAINKKYKVYIVKFDLPSYSENAYLHCKTEKQAKNLLKRKVLKIAGGNIIAYEYESEKRQIYSNFNSKNISAINSGAVTPQKWDVIDDEVFNASINDTAYNSGEESPSLSDSNTHKQYNSPKELANSRAFKNSIKVIEDLAIERQEEDAIQKSKDYYNQYNQNVSNLTSNLIDTIMTLMDLPDFNALFNQYASIVYEATKQDVLNMYLENVDLLQIKQIVTNQIVQLYSSVLMQSMGINNLII